MRIDIVDNDPAFAQSAKLILQARGHRVRGFTCPKQALDALTRDTPDVLVVDLVMPDLSGPELLTALSERGRRPSATILVSAHTDLADGLELTAYGITAFLPKPLDITRLFDAIEGPEQSLSMEPTGARQ